MSIVLDGTSGITTNSGTVVSTTDATLNGLTVGKGGGSVSTNTAVGASALSSNTTGYETVAFGNQALNSNTTGLRNSALGFQTLYTNSTGNYNTAVGWKALNLSTGDSNTGVGYTALQNTSSGTANTAVGLSALASNTTASNNTAVGYQAGYSNTTGDQSVYIGTQAAYTLTTGTNNTVVGFKSGYSLTTGTGNTFIGNGYNQGSGYSMTTGSRNTIIGGYTGNSGGLDIRTSNNYIVLSDGDGNPQVYYNGFNTLIANANTGQRYTGYQLNTGGSYRSQIYYDNTNTALYVQNASGGVYLSGNNTSWTANSDERLKENLVPIQNGLSKVCSLRSVIGNFISDENKKKTPFLIAQDVQAVLPEAVTTSTFKDDETNTEYLGIQYTEVIPLLVASIKELKTIVDAQAAEIAELKAKVA